MTLSHCLTKLQRVSLSAAACLKHRPCVPFPTLSAASAAVQGSGVLAARQPAASEVTHRDMRACAEASRGSYADHMFFRICCCHCPSPILTRRQSLSFLRYGFPASYQGPVSTPSDINHPSAFQHPCDVKKYIVKEVSAWPFHTTPFPSMVSD